MNFHCIHAPQHHPKRPNSFEENIRKEIRLPEQREGSPDGREIPRVARDDAGGLRTSTFNQLIRSQSIRVPRFTSFATRLPSNLVINLGGKPCPGRIARKLSGVKTSPACKSSQI